MLPAGTRLGPYELIALVGEGGMGQVYKARDTRLDRLVAIKMLPASVAADTQRRERFEREARNVSRLEHPHICPLYDVGEHEGHLFIVMQFLEGETLAERLTAGPCRSHTPSSTAFKSRKRWRRRIAPASCTAISSPATS